MANAGRILCLLAVPLTLAAQNIITTFAGTDYVFSGNGQRAVNASLGAVSAVITDGQGTVYLADVGNHLVAKFGADGILSVVAGTGESGHGGDGGPAIGASLGRPLGLALDPTGNLYIADETIIRRITPSGIISTFAGPAQGIVFVEGLSTDSAGNLYAADSVLNKIFKFTPAGAVSVFAGTGQQGFSGDNGPPAQAMLSSPTGVLVLVSGDILIADYGNNRIRRVSNGIITTIAGTGAGGFSGDGLALSQSLQNPVGMAVDRQGNILIADGGNNRVRRLANGFLTTVAGSAVAGFFGDGGPATQASLNFPAGVATDSVGNIYIADDQNNRVRRISPNGNIFTAAGNGFFEATGDGGPAIGATFNNISAIVFDAANNLYIADRDANRVRRIDSNGIITTFAGNGVAQLSGDGGDSTSASLNLPLGLTLDASGNVFIADRFNNRIRMVTPQGVIKTFAGGGTLMQDGVTALDADLGGPLSVLADGAGNLYYIDSFNLRVRRISNGGIITTVAGGGTSQVETGPATAVALKGPESLALDNSGNLYIGDVDRVRRVTPGGTISTFAGTGSAGFSGDNGPATAAAISDPRGLLIDKSGAVYIADTENNRVRRIAPNGNITTIAGTRLGGSSGDGGPAAQAELFAPVGVALDPDGNLYIADAGNHRIRRVLAGVPTYAVSPAALTFSANVGGAPPTAQNLVISVPFAGPPFTLSVSTSDNGGWLQVNATSGVLPATIQITVDPTGLSAGSYQGKITVNVPFANPASKVVNVTLTVGQTQSAIPGIDQGALTFSFVAGSNAATSQLRLTNRGGGSFNYTATIGPGAPWLSVAPAQGGVSALAPALLSVTADPKSLAPGTYTAQVLIRTGSQQILIPVTATVNAGRQTIVLSQTGLTFTSVVGGGAAPPQTFGVINSGQGVMNWTVQSSTISGGNWLQVSPVSGSTDAASLVVPLVSVAVDASGLSTGTYYGQIMVVSPTANNSPQTATVVLNVLAAGSDPGPLIRPTGLIFAALAGSGNPPSQTFTITNLSATPFSFISGAISDNPGNLFTYTPALATVVPNQPVQISVTPNLNGVPPGVYRGTLTLQFSSGIASTVNLVFLVVAPGGGNSGSAAQAGTCTPQKLLLAPTSLAYGFSVLVTFPVGIEVKIVDDCGQPFIQGSVVASFSNGDPALALASLKDGRWSGTWMSQNAAGPVIITVTAGSPSTSASGSIQLSGGTQPNPDPPIVGNGAIVSAASLALQAPIAPGTLVSIFGARLSSQTNAASSLPLGIQLGDASAVIAGRSFPLLYASGSQINAVMPYGLPLNTSLQVVVQRGGTYTTPQSIQVAAAQPGIFTVAQSGQGQGIVVDANNKIVDATNPAKAGDPVVIYCTGLGEVNPPVLDGVAAPLSPPLSQVVNAVTVNIGGQTAQVLFAGLTPGAVGLYQVNAIVPSGVQSTATPVTVSAAGQTSLPVTIAIR